MLLTLLNSLGVNLYDVLIFIYIFCIFTVNCSVSFAPEMEERSTMSIFFLDIILHS